MAQGHYYVVNSGPVACSVAATLIQIVASSTVPLELIEARVSETVSVTSTKVRIQINRKTVAAGAMTAFTPLLVNAVDSAAAAAGGPALTAVYLASQTEGTDSDILVQDTFNILSPWLYLPVPEQRIIVPPSGIICLKIPVGVAGTYESSIVFREIR